MEERGNGCWWKSGGKELKREKPPGKEKGEQYFSVCICVDCFTLKCCLLNTVNKPHKGPFDKIVMKPGQKWHIVPAD